MILFFKSARNIFQNYPPNFDQNSSAIFNKYEQGLDTDFLENLFYQKPEIISHILKK